MKISVLHAIAEFNLAHGGPPRSVAALVNALSGIDNTKVGLAFGGELNPAVDSFIGASVSRFSCADSSAALRFLIPSFENGLRQAIHSFQPALLHSHGVWRAENHWMAKVARSSSVLHVVQPRGMLSDWALKQKRTKKLVAWWAYQRGDLMRADGLVATSTAESADFRKAGAQAPIAVIPNGVDLPLNWTKVQTSNDPRTALFLSRLHRGKGLLELLRTWARVRPAGWRLRIAGRDTDKLWPHASALCDQLGLDEVEYLGEVDSAEATLLYRQADVFVLPTHSENFGLVIAEALAHGLPVLTTRGAPWSELIRYDCGWWIEVGEAALEEGLRDVAAQPRERLLEMGRNGRRLAENYSWQIAAKKTLAYYRWLISGGSRPGFVNVDNEPAPKIAEDTE